MRDFIFIIGPSGIGKTTLAKKLFEHYKSTYIEQNMVPEFISKDGGEEVRGELEEKTCWLNTVAMLKCFNELGYKNVLGLDFDDLRTRDIPEVFKGYDFITIKLISTNLKQIQEQMKYREEGGLIDYELQQKMNQKNLNRSPLINEFTIDVSGKDAEQVFQEAIEIVENAKNFLEYEYVKPPKELFYSWIFSNGLR